jgi:maleate isomerase
VRDVKRVGLIVPSSNTTIETEVPAMLRAADLDVDVTFHSSRAVLQNVDTQSLARMVADGDRNVSELADARVDALVYACLVALMARGPRAHEQAEAHLAEVAAAAGCEAPVISSAGALIRTIQAQGASRVAIITPYMPELTRQVAAYIEDYDIEVVDSRSLSVPDNVEVGRLDPEGLPGHARRLDLRRADLLIASCCVQMPSLSVLDRIETEVGLPVISAATASTAELLDALGLPRHVPGAGGLLRATDAAGR